MSGAHADAGLELVSELTAAIGREIGLLDPAAPIAWPDLPDVTAMVLHVGNVHRWVTAVVQSGSAVDAGAVATTPGHDLRAWFEAGRLALLEALGSSHPEDPCWVLGATPGTAGFWRRRMIYENAKHLMDLRASGGRPWTPAEELSAADYADGIDELLAVFLPRSRPRLPPLPGPIVLRPTDIDSGWRIDRDWAVSGPTDVSFHDDDVTRVSARASDLALALWERADLRDQRRFHVHGSRATVDALASAHIHPW